MTVLKNCNGDYSSENIMKQAASLKKVKLPLLLPGMSVSTGSDDYLPFQQLQRAASTARAGSASAKFWTTAEDNEAARTYHDHQR